MAGMCAEQQKMLQEINILSFICVEMALYLDTHPCETEALSYFQRNKMMLEQLRKEYARLYTPLTLSDVSSETQKWQWVLDPMPWEGV